MVFRDGCSSLVETENGTMNRNRKGRAPSERWQFPDQNSYLKIIYKMAVPWFPETPGTEQTETLLGSNSENRCSTDRNSVLGSDNGDAVGFKHQSGVLTLIDRSGDLE
jgi:hypothetical protein